MSDGHHGAIPPSGMTRVRALFAASVIVPIIFLIGGGWEDLYQLQRQTMRNLFAATAILREEARQVLESQTRVMELIDQHFDARAEEGREAMPGADDYLREIDNVFDEINGIWVSRPGARASASVTNPPPAGGAVHRDYVVPENRGGVVVSIDPIPNQDGSSSKVTISRQRVGGGPIANVTMNVNLEPVARFYQSFRADWARDRSIVLLREDGVALARDPPLTDPAGLQPATERFIPALHGGIRGFHHGVFDGETKERIFGVEKVPGFPVYVAFGITNDSVIQRWYRHLAFFGVIALAMMAVMLAASLVAWRSARRERRMAERLRAALVRAVAPAHREAAE